MPLQGSGGPFELRAGNPKRKTTKGLTGFYFEFVPAGMAAAVRSCGSRSLGKVECGHSRAAGDGGSPVAMN